MIVQQSVELDEIDGHQDSSINQVNVALLHQLKVDLEDAPSEGEFEPLARSSLTLLIILVLLRIEDLIHINYIIIYKFKLS